MATFVLVHGGWHGKWCWSRLSNELSRRGHRTIAPTLRGLADRQHELSLAINLTAHIEDVIAAAGEVGEEPFILCGHSYGGMVISGATESLHSKLKAIVYIDAFVPKDGDTSAGLAEFVVANDVMVPPPSAEWFSIEHPADREMVQQMMTPHPSNTMLEPVRLTGATDKVQNKGYILCKGFDAPLFADTHARLSEDANWRTFTMDTGHHPMLDRPIELADILEDIAQ